MKIIKTALIILTIWITLPSETKAEFNPIPEENEEDQKNNATIINFGNYTAIFKDPETCLDIENLEELSYGSVKISKGEEKLRKKFRYGEEYMSRFSKTGDIEHIYDLTKHSFNYMIFHIILLIITIFFLCCVCWCLIIRGISRGVHRCKKRLKERRENKLERQETGENLQNKEKKKQPPTHRNENNNQCLMCLNTKRSRCCLYTCNIILAFVVMMLLMVWNFSAGDAVQSMKRSDCVINKAFNGVKEGFYSKAEISSGSDTAYFGIEGYINLLQTFKAEIGNVKVFKESYIKLANGVNEIEEAMAIIAMKFKLKEFDSPVEGIEEKIIPDFSNSLAKNGNFPQTFSCFDKAKNALLHVINFQVTTIYFEQRKSEKMKISMEKIIEYMEKIKEGLIILNKEYIRPYSYKVQGRRLDTISNSITGWFIVLTVIYLIAFTCSYHVRAAVKLSVCFQAFYSIVILYMASVVLGYSIGSYSFSAVAFNVCTRANLILDNEFLVENLVPESLYKMSKSCFSEKNADGFYVDDIGDDISKDYEMLRNVLFASSVELKEYGYGEDGKFNLFEDLKFFSETGIGKIKNFEINDFANTNKNYNPDTSREEISKIINCEKNELQFDQKNCKKEPISKPEDSETYKVGEDYCLVPSLMGYKKFSDRYKSPSCASESIPLYTKLANFMSEFQSFLDEVKTEVDSKLIPLIPGVDNELGVLKKMTENANQSIPLTKKFFENFTFNSMANCKETKKLLKDALGTTCFQLVPSFWEQTKYTLIIGPLLFLFGCFNFCGVLTSRIKLIEKDLYGRGAVRQYNGTNNEMRDDLDQAPSGLGTKMGFIDRRKTNQKLKMKDGFDFDDEENEKSSRAEIDDELRLPPLQ